MSQNQIRADTNVQVDKSTKLQPKDEPKSDDLKKQRQLRREKKKLLRLNKKKNKKQENLSVKNQNLNPEAKLSSILNQSKVNNKTIINHYKNLATKVSEDQVGAFVNEIKVQLLDENLNKELKNHLVNDLNRFVNILIVDQNNDNTDLLLMIIKFLALNSSFSSTWKDDDQLVKNIEPDTQACFQSTLAKTISVIIHSIVNKKKKKTIEMSKLDLLYQVMKHIYTFINNDDVKEDHPIKSDYNLIFKKISNSYKQIQLKEDDLNQQSILLAFFTFYVFLGLNVFIEQQWSVQVLDEINECFKRFSSNKQDKDDLYWADVFAEILVSLLLKPNSLKRTISDEVFALISKKVTKTGLEQLLTALISDNFEEEAEEHNDNDEFMDAQEDLDNEESEKESEDEETKSDDEANSDAENDDDENEDEENDLDIDENCVGQEFNLHEDDEEEKTKEKSEEDDDDETEDEDSEGESDTESIDDEFRLKLKNALGSAAVDEESEDEIVYDDDEMFKFDEAISKVFKEKRKIKNKTQELIEFKSRCFDLVQILIKESNLEFLIETAKTILQVLKSNNNSKSYDLIVKASATLKKYPSIDHELSENDKEVVGENLLNLIKKSLHLVKKLPEKVRSNLNCFIIWLIDLSKLANLTETDDLILNDFENKLKKASEVSLFVLLAERKKSLAESMLKRLVKIELDQTKLKNFELYSYFKLLTACYLNSTQAQLTTKSIALSLHKIVSKSVHLINLKKKQQKANFLVEELFRFLSVFMKSNSELIKKDADLVGKLRKLGNETKYFKMSKKLKQKFKSSLKAM